MNPRIRTGLIIVIVGVIFIAAGVYVAIRYLNVTASVSQTPAIQTPGPETMTLIAFAANDVTAGTVLEAQDITFTEVPIEFAPRDTITSPDNAIGRISKIDLYQGQMILEHNLANPTGQIYDIAYILDETHVLMAVPATDLMSKESLIKRGDIVSIMVSIRQNLEFTEEITGAPAQTDEKNPQLVAFTAFQRLDVTAIVMDIVTNDNTNTTRNEVPLQGDAGPDRTQIVVQAYLIALDPQDALVLKYLKDIGGVFDFVLLAPTSSGSFNLTPVTAQFIKELYGLELIP